MASTTDQCTCLGNDVNFRLRARSLFLLECGAVFAEVNTTPNHSARSNFASKIVQSPTLADTLAPALCQMTNLTGANTTFNFANGGRVETDATDAAIRSQIATSWNLFAGIST